MQLYSRHEGSSNCLEDESEQAKETSKIGSEARADGEQADEEGDDGEEEGNQVEGPGDAARVVVVAAVVEEVFWDTLSGAKIALQVEWNGSASGGAIRIATASSAANGEIGPSYWVETSGASSWAATDAVGGALQEVHQVHWTAVDSGENDEELQQDASGSQNDGGDGENGTCADMSCCVAQAGICVRRATHVRQPLRPGIATRYSRDSRCRQGQGKNSQAGRVVWGRWEGTRVEVVIGCNSRDQERLKKSGRTGAQLKKEASRDDKLRFLVGGLERAGDVTWSTPDERRRGFFDGDNKTATRQASWDLHFAGAWTTSQRQYCDRPVPCRMDVSNLFLQLPDLLYGSGCC